MNEPKLPLFYRRPRPLQANRDAELSLRTDAGHLFAARTNSVPLVATEFATACLHYPILFTDSELPQPAALLGLRAEENLFVDAEGVWEPETYVPAYVRRYPFIFIENPTTSEYTLCVDEAADCVVPGTENPFFAEGKPTEVTNTALKLVSEYQAQSQITTEFSKAVVAADLLIERRATITLAGNRTLTLSGFKMIDEDKFNALPGEEFQRWRERGWLTLVYTHLVSAGNWGRLVNRLSERDA